MARRVLMALALTVASGCYLGDALSNSGYPCETSANCPSGLVCKQQICRKGAASDGGNADGGDAGQAGGDLDIGGQSAPCLIAVDETKVFWASCTGRGGVHAVPLGGGPGVSELFDGQANYTPAALALGGSYVFVVLHKGLTDPDLLVRIAKDGSGSETILNDQKLFPTTGRTSLVADGQNVYWFNLTSTPAEVCRRPLGGGNTEQRCRPTATGNPAGLARLADRILFVEDGTVGRLPLAFDGSSQLDPDEPGNLDRNVHSAASCPATAFWTVRSQATPSIKPAAVIAWSGNNTAPVSTDLSGALNFQVDSVSLAAGGCQPFLGVNLGATGAIVMLTQGIPEVRQVGPVSSLAIAGQSIYWTEGGRVRSMLR